MFVVEAVVEVVVDDDIENVVEEDGVWTDVAVALA